MEGLVAGAEEESQQEGILEEREGRDGEAEG